MEDDTQDVSTAAPETTTSHARAPETTPAEERGSSPWSAMRKLFKR